MPVGLFRVSAVYKLTLGDPYWFVNQFTAPLTAVKGHSTLPFRISLSSALVQPSRAL